MEESDCPFGKERGKGPKVNVLFIVAREKDGDSAVMKSQAARSANFCMAIQPG